MQLPRPSLACNVQLPDAEAIAFEFGLRHPIRVDQDPDLVRPRPSPGPRIDNEPPQFPWPWIFLIVFFAGLLIYGVSQS